MLKTKSKMERWDRMEVPVNIIKKYGHNTQNTLAA